MKLKIAFIIGTVLTQLGCLEASAPVFLDPKGGFTQRQYEDNIVEMIRYNIINCSDVQFSQFIPQLGAQLATCPVKDEPFYYSVKEETYTLTWGRDRKIPDVGDNTERFRQIMECFRNRKKYLPPTGPVKPARQEGQVLFGRPNQGVPRIPQARVPFTPAGTLHKGIDSIPDVATGTKEPSKPAPLHPVSKTRSESTHSHTVKKTPFSWLTVKRASVLIAGVGICAILGGFFWYNRTHQKRPIR